MAFQEKNLFLLNPAASEFIPQTISFIYSNVNIIEEKNVPNTNNNTKVFQKENKRAKSKGDNTGKNRSFISTSKYKLHEVKNNGLVQYPPQKKTENLKKSPSIHTDYHQNEHNDLHQLTSTNEIDFILPNCMLTTNNSQASTLSEQSNTEMQNVSGLSYSAILNLNIINFSSIQKKSFSTLSCEEPKLSIPSSIPNNFSSSDSIIVYQGNNSIIVNKKDVVSDINCDKEKESYKLITTKPSKAAVDKWKEKWISVSQLQSQSCREKSGPCVGTPVRGLAGDDHTHKMVEGSHKWHAVLSPQQETVSNAVLAAGCREIVVRATEVVQPVVSVCSHRCLRLKDKDSCNIWWRAVMDGDADMIRALLCAGFDWETTLLAAAELLVPVGDEDRDCNALQYLVKRTDNMLCLETLLSMPHIRRCVDQRERRLKQTLLHIACGRGSPELVRLLIRCGADPGCLDRLGETALHKASRSACCVTVALICDKAPTIVNIRNRRRESALLLAVSADKEAAVAVPLLRCGADVSAVNSSGLTALDLAAEKGYLRLVRLLTTHYRGQQLQLPVKLDNNTQHKNKQNKVVTTPLHQAVRYSRVECLNYLLGTGLFSTAARDSDGMTPLLLAASMGNFPAFQTLLQHGADLYLEIDGRNPFLLAALNGHSAFLGSCRALVRTAEIKIQHQNSLGLTMYEVLLLSISGIGGGRLDDRLKYCEASLLQLLLLGFRGVDWLLSYLQSESLSGPSTVAVELLHPLVSLPLLQLDHGCCDVLIRLQDAEVLAHSFALAHSSCRLKDMLRACDPAAPGRPAVLLLQQYSHTVFGVALHWMYHHIDTSASLSRGHLAQLLLLARELMCISLYRRCRLRLLRLSLPSLAVEQSATAALLGSYDGWLRYAADTRHDHMFPSLWKELLLGSRAIERAGPEVNCVEAEEISEGRAKMEEVELALLLFSPQCKERQQALKHKYSEYSVFERCFLLPPFFGYQPDLGVAEYGCSEKALGDLSERLEDICPDVVLNQRLRDRWLGEGDLLLLADGEEQFRAHRAVLVSASSKFKAMISFTEQQQQQQHGAASCAASIGDSLLSLEVHLSPPLLRCLLRFVYTGLVRDDEGDEHLLLHMVAVADQFLMADLRIVLETRLRLRLDSYSAEALFCAADSLQLADLRRGAAAFILRDSASRCYQDEIVEQAFKHIMLCTEEMRAARLILNTKESFKNVNEI